MKKKVLHEKTEQVKNETANALKIMYNALNEGQKKQIAKENAVRILFERYGVITQQ